MSNSQTKAILVTGGRGFVGRHLVERLKKQHSGVVLSADILSSPPNSKSTRSIEIEIDIRDRKRLHELFNNFDISTVFDLASITDVQLSEKEYSPNIDMTRSMIECVQDYDVKNYVFFSSQFVFRKERSLPASEEDYFPIDSYGESKIYSERFIRANLPEGRWLILRPTYVWGEGNRRFRDGFLYRLAKGQLLLPLEKSLLRYYGYVDTVCEQAAMLAARPIAELPSKVFYLSDLPISMREFCEYFVNALGCGKTWLVPGPLLRSLGQLGDAAASINLPFPINALQANEMTRSYPIPIDRTLAITGITTEYPCAARVVVAWALSDPDFTRRIRR